MSIGVSMIYEERQFILKVIRSAKMGKHGMPLMTAERNSALFVE